MVKLQRMQMCAGLVVFVATFFAGLNCLTITKISVPKFVQNGTEESVVLDCEYDYELEKDVKLVVKWFHNDDPNPVYQWIPEIDVIQSSDRFGDRVNIEYEVSAGNNYTKRRALNILRPTTELSGMYYCHISSFAGFDTKGEVMMVYAHPTNINLNYSVTHDIVRVFCVVENVYPVPEMEIFQTAPGESDPIPVEDVELHHVLQDDAYDVVLSTNMTEDELETDTLHYFDCVVSIAGTTYTETKRVPYFPAANKAQMKGDDFDAAAKSVHSIIVLVFLFALSQLLQMIC